MDRRLQIGSASARRRRDSVPYGQLNPVGSTSALGRLHIGSARLELKNSGFRHSLRRVEIGKISAFPLCYKHERQQMSDKSKPSENPLVVKAIDVGFPRPEIVTIGESVFANLPATSTEVLEMKPKPTSINLRLRVIEDGGLLFNHLHSRPQNSRTDRIRSLALTGLMLELSMRGGALPYPIMMQPVSSTNPLPPVPQAAEQRPVAPEGQPAKLSDADFLEDELAAYFKDK